MRYTTVIGVDAKHLRQLEIVWPTWMLHKPALTANPLVVFYDKEQVNPLEVSAVVGKHPDYQLYAWPHASAGAYEGDANNKWTNPQRYKMLAGFVYVPPICVSTEYWLKLDVDTVATGQGNWVNDAWFDGTPGIVAQPWGFTKPPSQMLELDVWARDTKQLFDERINFPWPCQPLQLIPKPGWSRIKHKRIISWCGFFNTQMTDFAARTAARTCGEYKLPVPSQDGFLWYVAQRMGYKVCRVNMKDRGWEHWTTMRNIKNAAERALA